MSAIHMLGGTVQGENNRDIRPALQSKRGLGASQTDNFQRCHFRAPLRTSGAKTGDERDSQPGPTRKTASDRLHNHQQRTATQTSQRFAVFPRKQKTNTGYLRYCMHLVCFSALECLPRFSTDCSLPGSAFSICTRIPIVLVTKL
eukprot:766618-Hanusia_phi.AAC.10